MRTKKITSEMLAAFLKRNGAANIKTVAFQFGVTYITASKALNEAASNRVISKYREGRELMFEIWEPLRSFIDPYGDNSRSQSEAQKPAEQNVVPLVEVLPAEPAQAVTSGTQALSDAYKLFVNRLAMPIADLIAGELVEQIQREVAARLKTIQLPDFESTKNEVAQKAIEKVKKPRVCVIGLNPTQSHLIRSEFEKELHLEFITADEVSKVAGASRNAGLTIVMTDYVSHKIVEKARSAGAKIELMTGGASTLRDKLIEAYVALSKV